MSLLFVALFLLVTLSVGATFWGIQAQKADALLINLAGRQRMLTQKMVWLALATPQSPDLSASIVLFEQTLDTLRYGGATQYSPDQISGSPEILQSVRLPAAPDQALRNQLDQVASLWVVFRSHLEPVDAAALQAQAPVILAELDVAVQLYQERAHAKLVRVQLIQAGSFIAGLALLAWGYLLTRKRIFRPLAALGTTARRMSQGQLNQPVPALGPDELGELGQAFETLRTEIVSAQGNLEGQVMQRTRELAAAFEFSQEIVAQLDLQHLLQSVIERARSLTNASASALCLLDQDPSSLVLVARSGGQAGPVGLRQPVDNDPAFRVINAGETVVTTSDCTRCRFLKAHPGVCAVAPLHSNQTTLGALCVVRPNQHPIDLGETRALTLLANTATIAISNAKLVETGQRQAEQAAMLSERERLAAELHDNLAQTLGFLNLKVDQIRLMFTDGRLQESSTELAAVKSAINGAYEQVRAALVGLSDPLPTGEDFSQKLVHSIEALPSLAGSQVQLDIQAVEALSLSKLAQSQAIHIVREALTNAQRYAGAQNIWVRVRANQELAQITIEDDGSGFDPQAVAGRNHMGLRLMRARAERSGGSLIVESTPGEGTRVEVSYPIGAINE